MEANLEKEFKFFLSHQDELVKEHQGKVLVIKNERVLGAYNSELEAVEKTRKNHEIGTFLVQKCEPGEESYTAIYHSRVA
jgi:hypothetical protein